MKSRLKAEKMIFLAVKLLVGVFILLINVKMPLIVGILTFYKQDKSRAQLILALKSINLEQELDCCDLSGFEVLISCKNLYKCRFRFKICVNHSVCFAYLGLIYH